MERVLIALLLGAASPALAQDGGGGGFDAHGFQLAAHDADLRDPLVVQRAGAFSQGDFFLGTVAEYAEAPLVLVRSPASGEAQELPVLDDVFAMNLSAGVAVHDHLRLDLKAPVYLVSSGFDPGQGGLERGTSGPAMGDLRASAMLLVIRPRHVVGGGGFGFGVVGYVDAPTGTPDRFLGQGAVAGGGRLTATYEFPVATLSADIGTQFNPTVEGLDNLNGSDQLIANLALGLLASDTVGFTFEAATAPPFEPPERLSFPAEGIVSMRYKDPKGGPYLTLGGAMGLTSGPGVAAYRALLGFGYAQQEPPRQPDFDPIGRLTTTDLCPAEEETQNGYKDDDGCADRLGALAIDVRYRGEPWQAQAKISGPDGAREEVVTPRGLQLDAVPGSQWTVNATANGCLHGSAAAMAAETGTALVVNLEPKLDAHVLVEVVGPDDLPLPEAQVVWTGELVQCIPQGMQKVNTSGMLEQDLVSGTHHVVVTAPGHTVFEEDVVFATNEDKVLRVKLDITRIRVEKKQIVILDKVHFETAKAVIKPESFGLLNEVAAVILTNPDLGRVEVGGHTDSRGSDSYNMTLSQERADSVKAYLVGQAIPDAQLVSVGYGETLPVDTNKTDVGREANRRVEFNLIDKHDEGEGSPGAEGDQP